MRDALDGIVGLRGRDLTPFAVAGAASLTLLLLGTAAGFSVWPWGWLAVVAPLGAQLLDRSRSGPAERRAPVPELSVDLRSADLGRAALAGADLRDRDLTAARLVGADLVGADLTGATLAEARLDRADLRRANLIDADLRRASLEGADLRGADLTGATVGTRALARAFTDATTTLANGSPAPDTGAPPSTAATARGSTSGLATSWQLVRPTVLGVGVALTATAMATSAGHRIGSAGFEIATDLASHETVGTPDEVGGVDRLHPVGEVGRTAGTVRRGTPPLVEVEVPVTAAAAATPPSPESATGTTTDPSPSTTTLPTGPEVVRVVASSDGLPSTATIRSALGIGELQVTGQQQVDLDATPGGPVRVRVVPGDESTAVSCGILVDGVERSFRQGFAGETVSCEVDLDRRSDPASP